MACMIWGPWWPNNRVVVHCDNQAAVCIVNAGYSHDKDMMYLMRCLFFIRAYWGIDLWAVHIPGEQNVAADAISRGNLSTLFQVSPQVSPLPTVVPQSLHNLLVVQQPDWTSPSWSHCSGAVCGRFGRLHPKSLQVRRTALCRILHQDRCYPISNQGDNPFCLCSSPVQGGSGGQHGEVLPGSCATRPDCLGPWGSQDGRYATIRVCDKGAA